MATFPTVYAGQRATASLIQSMVPQIAYKSADETVNNSASLQDDNELFLSVVIGTYLLDTFFKYTTGDTPDIQFAWSTPASTTMYWSPHGIGSTVTAATGDIRVTSEAGSSPLALGGGGGVGVTAIGHGTVVITTAGTLQLRWAQNVATASNTVLNAYSWIKLTRIA